MVDVLGRRGGGALPRFTILDLSDGGALSRRGSRARRRAERRDRAAQEGLAALGRIQRDDDVEDPGTA